MKRLLAPFLLAASLAALGAPPSPGGLDPAFGTGGATFTNLGPATPAMIGATAMALQPDGKVVVAATGLQSGTLPLLARFNADGTLDATFNSRGYTTRNPGEMFSVGALTLQSDGKIVVVGSNGPLSVARFNADGSPDLTFNGTGATQTVIGQVGMANAVAVQGDGKIVAAGYVQYAPFVLSLLLVRYNTDGTPDTSFDADGVIANMGPVEGAFALAIQSDGKIVVGGHANGGAGNNDFAVTRFNSDGTLDTTFNGSGSVTTALSSGPDQIRALQIAPDGKILAAGVAAPAFSGGLDGTGFGFARYNADGSLDTTFNGTGWAYYKFLGPQTNSAATSMALLPDGRILAAGIRVVGTVSNLAMMRLTATGILDTTFGDGTGRFSPDTPYGPYGPGQGLNEVALRPDGKAVAAGFTGPGKDYLLLRVDGAGIVDASFGQSGYATMPAFPVPDAASAVGIQADGKIVAAGYSFDYQTTYPATLARYATNGRLDLAYGGGRAAFAANASFPSRVQAYALALQADGRVVIAGDVTRGPIAMGDFGGSLFMLARFDTSGFVDASVVTAMEARSSAKAVKIQGDGKIVAAGYSNSQSTAYDPPGKDRFLVARYNADLTPDTSFNGSGRTIVAVGTGESEAKALAIRADGSIVAAGSAHSGTSQDWAFATFSAAGAPTGSVLVDLGGSNDVAYAMVLQPDGAILAAGSAGNQAALARFSAPGTYDAAFAEGGRFMVRGAPFVSIALQADGRIVALTRDFHVWRFTAAGVPDATFGVGGRVVLSMGAGSNANAVAVQADGRIVVAGNADGGFGQDFVVARIDPATALELVPSTTSLDLETSPTETVTFTNPGPGALTIDSVTATGGYSISSNTCAALPAAGSTCQVGITPGVGRGTLLVEYSPGRREAIAVTLDGGSLVTHYYRSILRREPDAGGKAFWDSEANRVAGLGGNVNEAWYAMAQSFYTSAEYAAFNRDNAGFATDLYNSFFNRAPDSGGLAYWKGLLDSGLPREVLLAQFMFSPEFTSFTQAIFGAPNSRAEADVVMDFYRGLLGRLPDDGGFNAWVGRFRTAQCQGSAAVVSEVEAISSAFTLSGEYAVRGRTNAQYVGGLYNAFLRRGGDLPGVQHWIGQLDSAAMTREQLRVQFKNSAEFQQRVNAIVLAGCIQ